DRLQPQLGAALGRRLPPPVVDGLEAPAAFVDDAVPACSRTRIDAENSHAERLGTASDVPSRAEIRSAAVLRTTVRDEERALSRSAGAADRRTARWAGVECARHRLVRRRRHARQDSELL